MKRSAFFILFLSLFLFHSFFRNADARVVDYYGGMQKYKYGVGLRGGMLFVPEFFLTGLFFDEAQGVTQGGFSVEFILRSTDTFEYTFGLGWYNLAFGRQLDRNENAIPAIFVNKGDPKSEREIVENTLSYVALDVRFTKHFPIHRHVSFFLGGGVGIGFVVGQLTRTDTIPNVFGANYDRWRSDPYNNAPPAVACPIGGLPSCALGLNMPADKNIGEGGRREGRVPPVLPILDFFLGFNFPIHPRVDIRVEGSFGVPRIFAWNLSSHFYF
jgi:hypothetical protein